MDTLSSIAEILGLLVALVLILVATYYTTRFIAKHTGNALYSKNIEVIETYKLTTNKYLQLVKVAGRYLVIALTKDNVTFITEVDEKDIDMSFKDSKGSAVPFQEILKKHISKDKKEN